MQLTPLFFLLGAVSAVEYCGRAGVCWPPKTCIDSGYSVATGLCSGGANNRCCSANGQCGTGGTGQCKYTSQGCSGTWQSGFCPGGSDFKCCN